MCQEALLSTTIDPPDSRMEKLRREKISNFQRRCPTLLTECASGNMAVSHSFAVTGPTTAATGSEFIPGNRSGGHKGGIVAGGRATSFALRAAICSSRAVAIARALSSTTPSVSDPSRSILLE